jgi:hypothetical protein
MKKEIQVHNYDVTKMAEVAKMAIILKDFVVKQNLYTPIMGKNYVNVEGWQFAGGLMGLFPKVVKVENIAPNKWLAQVDIINQKTDKIVSTGYAICSKEENKKKSFDEYAILSMAQTRAIGKAYRNLVGWVMKLAGYEGTPSEEMKNEVAQPIEAKQTEKIEQKEVAMILQKCKEKNIVPSKIVYQVLSKKVALTELTKDEATRVLAKILI